MSWNGILNAKKERTVVTLHVSVWVEIFLALSIPSSQKSRSTWACELKCFLVISTSCKTTSRSTWACELKCIVLVEIIPVFAVTLHVSVWVEIQCPLKLCDSIYRHAPRERVSWNSSISSNIFAMSVTLHVSVWVEIITFSYFNQSARRHAPRERVSWNEKRVAEHNNFARSRSTWACELKYAIKSKNI